MSLHPLLTSTNGSQTFWRDAVTWKYLDHPNIVPFLGITIEPLQFVSVWISGVDLEKYIQNQDPDRLSLVGITLVTLI